jgi:hypothetical protein
MKISLKMTLAALALGISATTMAAPNDWNQYRGVDRHYHHAPPKAPPKWSNSHHERDRYVSFRKTIAYLINIVTTVITCQIGVIRAYLHRHVAIIG